MNTTRGEPTALFTWVTETYPKLNMLVNNAGIQQHIQLQQKPPWETLGEEVAINLEAPIHLSTLFIPYLLQQERSVIINITSGLAFVPKADLLLCDKSRATFVYAFATASTIRNADFRH